MGENIEGHTSNEVFTVGIYREIYIREKTLNWQKVLTLHQTGLCRKQISTWKEIQYH